MAQILNPMYPELSLNCYKKPGLCVCCVKLPSPKEAKSHVLSYGGKERL